MISLSEAQYAAIGRVVVESATLGHECARYLIALGVSVPWNLTPRLNALSREISTHVSSVQAVADLTSVIAQILTSVVDRNVVGHGVLSPVSNTPLVIGDTVASYGQRSFHVNEIARVAKKIRLGRKLLLRLMQDQLPQIVAGTRPIKKSADELRSALQRL